LVITAVLFILAAFAWAGWANWEYRKQAAERLLASTAQGELVPASGESGNPLQFLPALLGKPAPAFTLEDLSGKKVSLSDYQGKAVLLNFWATWCAPCKIETPWLIDLRNRYAAQGFEVLGISADDIDRDNPRKLNDEKQEIAHFVQQMHMPYPVLIDGDSISHSYGGLDALPATFFINRKGTIVAVQLGLTSRDEIELNIKKAMSN
jgi:cytochrome c biogenesis protein CcmG/thiol:disulfide interchange protein DsbE